MTELQWLACTDSQEMLAFLRGKVRQATEKETRTAFSEWQLVLTRAFADQDVLNEALVLGGEVELVASTRPLVMAKPSGTSFPVNLRHSASRVARRSIPSCSVQAKPASPQNDEHEHRQPCPASQAPGRRT